MGPGYTVHLVQSWIALQFDRGVLNSIIQHEPGKPEQFCIVLDGSKDESGRSPVSVAPFPVAWRLKVVHDEDYPDYEHVR